MFSPRSHSFLLPALCYQSSITLLMYWSLLEVLIIRRNAHLLCGGWVWVCTFTGPCFVHVCVGTGTWKRIKKVNLTWYFTFASASCWRLTLTVRLSRLHVEVDPRIVFPFKTDVKTVCNRDAPIHFFQFQSDSNTYEPIPILILIYNFYYNNYYH